MQLTIDDIEQIKKLVGQQLDSLLSNNLNKVESATSSFTIKGYRMTERQIRMDVIEFN